MVRPKHEKPRGILHLGPDSSISGHRRFWPDRRLAPWVEHFWTVEWDLAEPVVRELLPHPTVHLVIEVDRSRIVGIPAGRFTRRLEGKGRVLGVKFRAGGFRPFLRSQVSEISRRTLPPERVFGGGFSRLEEEALAHSDPGRAFEEIQSYLVARLPEWDGTVDRVRRIVERASKDRAITRVGELGRELGLGSRALQRLFSEYVGATPKWVIQRYRLHEAAERIGAGDFRDWVSLALDLGYSDQPHFIRDFRRWVGLPPGEYAEAVESVP